MLFHYLCHMLNPSMTKGHGDEAAQNCVLVSDKGWFSLNHNSSPIIVLEHRRYCKTMIGDELLK